MLKNKKLILSSAFMTILPIIAFSSCSEKVEVATKQEIVDGFKSINFKMDFNVEKVDLTFHISTHSKEWYPLFYLLRKYSFLDEYNSRSWGSVYLPLFVADASRNHFDSIDTKYTYNTRYDKDNFILYKSSYLDSHFSPFDIKNEKNYSFLYSSLNLNNWYTTTMSIPKWYLKQLADWKGYKDKEQKGISKFFLKIKPVPPYDLNHNNNDTDDDGDIRYSLENKQQLIIPFWLVEIIYDNEKDTFTAEIKDPDEPINHTLEN